MKRSILFAALLLLPLAHSNDFEFTLIENVFNSELNELQPTNTEYKYELSSSLNILTETIGDLIKVDLHDTNRTVDVHIKTGTCKIKSSVEFPQTVGQMINQIFSSYKGEVKPEWN